MRSTKEFEGARVLGGKNGTSRIGKIKRALFHPDTYDLIGYLVKRPDIAFVKARDDRFLAFDSFCVLDGNVVGAKDKSAWDQAACKRLGVDFDACYILEGMPIFTPSGEKLGYIHSLDYDERTGRIENLVVSDGPAANALLGSQPIPRKMLLGYKDGVVLVQDEALSVAFTGGLAATAGAGAAKAGDAISKLAEKAGEKLEEAAIKTGSSIKAKSQSIKGKQSRNADKVADSIDKGARAVGKQLKASKGMFKSFKDEYKKAAGSSGKNTAASKPKTKSDASVVKRTNSKKHDK